MTPEMLLKSKEIYQRCKKTAVSYQDTIFCVKKLNKYIFFMACNLFCHYIPFTDSRQTRSLQDFKTAAQQSSAHLWVMT